MRSRSRWVRCSPVILNCCAVMTEDFMVALERIEKSIRSSDGEAIRARWEFGRLVLLQRQGKQLPKGLTAEICNAAGISQRELSRRTQVAEVYDEAQLRHQCLSSDWTAIVN